MAKPYLWWAIFSVSGLLLLFLLFRYKYAFQWLGSICLNVVVAAFLLYILNLFGAYTQLEIPINPVTVGTVSILGVPGLVMLAALKLWVI
ncbi:pro-sigmaK processing inhibitor BofA family protein [Paenibacillus agricola]|uniref:Pro-sigmaK processing inhibitor BofA n=1 Tax=Paenibacillus agricola TaxID=2716264 RepID=A0ABX0JE40_9BACL|nr:pro-sigmaK processing inhibitor BofA family protein [Paenibacillus agricola]NHN31965.1 pro-sigmaK processing inhibitor BofA [Paenibacillus agricola]